MTNFEGADRLTAWWRVYRKSHRKFTFPVSYHPRSDEHSKQLCVYILEDLVSSCETLRRHAMEGRICYDVNHEVYRLNGTTKLLDLVIGEPATTLTGEAGVRVGRVSTPGIRIALEAKACMTKHHSAAPRLRDELTGAMGSAIDASPQAVVGGIVVVNASERFLSPTDQPDPLPNDATGLRRKAHNQPDDAAFVVERLGTLPFRAQPGDIGFDSLGIVVVRHDNEIPTPTVEPVNSWPSPPETSPRHYRSFVVDLGNKYRQRFG